MRARGVFLLSVLGVGTAGLVATTAGGTFSGQNGRISLMVFVGNGPEIHTANPDGSDVQRLTVTAGKTRGAFDSDWSPDGQRIAYDSETPGVEGAKDAVHVWMMNADGSNQVQLTRGPGFHGFPGFSPDGQRLAIDADWGKRALKGIWIIPASDPDGVTLAEATRVTDSPASYDSEPEFTPDGSRIVFTRLKLKNLRKSAIYIVNVDGSGLERLTSYKLNTSDPDISPDGTTITFDSGDAGMPGSKGDIYVMDLDGSNRQRLTDTPRLGPDFEESFNLSQNPVFSPAGDRIMFTQFFRTNRTRIEVMNTDGSERRVVLKGGFYNRVDWGTHP